MSVRLSIHRTGCLLSLGKSEALSCVGHAKRKREGKKRFFENKRLKAIHAKCRDTSVNSAKDVLQAFVALSAMEVPLPPAYLAPATVILPLVTWRRVGASASITRKGKVVKDARVVLSVMPGVGTRMIVNHAHAPAELLASIATWTAGKRLFAPVVPWGEFWSWKDNGVCFCYLALHHFVKCFLVILAFANILQLRRPTLRHVRRGFLRRFGGLSIRSNRSTGARSLPLSRLPV